MSLLFLSKIKLRSNYLNLLFCLIPLSFIAGNLIINLNIALIIFSAIIFYKLDIFKIKFFILDKIILIFFFFVCFTALINYFNNFQESTKYFPILVKTFSYLRYLLLYFVIRYMVENKLINFKYFFISASFFSFLVAIDIYYQFFTGRDIFGYEFDYARKKFSGPFGDELIAGGYLQRFSFFSFFLFPVFFSIKNKKLQNIIIVLLFMIYLSVIVIAGNRMPLLLFLFITTLIIFCEKSTRRYFFIIFIIVPIIFTTMYNSNIKIKGNLQVLYYELVKLTSIFKSDVVLTPSVQNKSLQVTSYNRPGAYFQEFETFYDTWQMNKFIGGGVRSFRINCPERENIRKNERSTCNTHPHNYYLEILTDLGLIGFFIISILFIITVYLSFIKKYFTSSHLRSNNIITPFIFLLLAEIFPVKSSGSFFTTGNATFIFLILAITIALSREQKTN